MINNNLIDDAFIDGFRRGLFWPDKWEEGRGKPGGPFVYDSEQSREENRAWKKGWELGHSQKLAGKRAMILTDPYKDRF